MCSFKVWLGCHRSVFEDSGKFQFRSKARHSVALFLSTNMSFSLRVSALSSARWGCCWAARSASCCAAAHHCRRLHSASWTSASAAPWGRATASPSLLGLAPSLKVGEGPRVPLVVPPRPSGTALSPARPLHAGATNCHHSGEPWVRWSQKWIKQWQCWIWMHCAKAGDLCIKWMFSFVVQQPILAWMGLWRCCTYHANETMFFRFCWVYWGVRN